MQTLERADAAEATQTGRTQRSHQLLLTATTTGKTKRLASPVIKAPPAL